MIALRHISILCFEEMRDIFTRMRAVLALALCVGTVGLFAYGFSQFDGLIGEIAEDQDAQAISTVLLEALKQFEFVKASKLLEHITKWPIVFPLFQFFLVLWLPTFVALVSCDMMTADLARGTLRFLFLKTTPSRYYFAKLLAHLLLYVLIHLISFSLLACLSVSFSQTLTIDDVLVPFRLSVTSFFPFILFLVATLQFVSALSSRSISVLLNIHILWIGLTVLMIVWPDGPLQGQHFVGVILPHAGYGLDSAIVLTSWSLAFIFLGLFSFRKREV